MLAKWKKNPRCVGTLCQRNESDSTTRTRACSYEMNPRFTAMQMAVSPKPRRRNAGHGARVPGAYIAAVLDESCLGIRLLPEEKEVRVLKLVQELIVVSRDRTRRGRGRCMRMLMLGLALRTLIARSSQSRDARERQAERNRRQLAQQSPAGVFASFLSDDLFDWSLVHCANFDGADCEARSAYSWWTSTAPMNHRLDARIAHKVNIEWTSIRINRIPRTRREGNQ